MNSAIAICKAISLLILNDHENCKILGGSSPTIINILSTYINISVTVEWALKAIVSLAGIYIYKYIYYSS